MSCYDPVTTSSAYISSSITTLPQTELSTLIETLATLQPLLMPSSTSYFNLPSVSLPVNTSVPTLTLPLLTTPLSTLSLASPIHPPLSLHSSLSPLSVNTQLEPSSSQLNTFGLGPFSPLPLLPPCGLGAGTSSGLPSFADSGLSPIGAAAQHRRQSAPEHVLRLPPSQERRRYSDFSVEALLSSHRVIQEQRRTSCGRKQRTIYGAKQTEVLEEAFHSQKYMVGTERELLAARLGLSEAQVRVWFQNRRSKQRKIMKHEEEKTIEQRRF